ncbi:hypothetical protein KAFR_0J01200 [Kazachstania africana CBS 2517]|uniref:Amino acid transporter transmembrane domain-containing protein n=1 Tax=Kazachstania africana (strain ATCC 22294 / BCRC 22015 / CBS 2517 / CECT 1963 / NBRC 1671 / NRRL Y-8276) TaxID=1071382 RepID=H2B0N7_KAZAF|nr:hypothetical protein KAFR_0J01200 [Kazachstania africana CBS 2517]CCF60187.1 hypothetical protein KAFR_0J01200 [Kazachstania africana CBS 2517]
MASDPEQQPLRDGNKAHSQVHYISIPIDRNPDYAAAAGSSSQIEDSSFTTRRQSILDQPIGSFKGVNSLSRFATSIRRATSFRNIELNTDKKRSYFNEFDDEIFDPESMAPSHTGRKLSVALGQQPNISMRPSIININTDTAIDESVDYGSIYSNNFENQSLLRSSISMAELAQNLTRDGYGGNVNAIAADTESIVLKRIEGKDGKVVTLLAGQSTAPQTIFNSINVLIGIGLLALPLGLNYAGWVLGILLLFIFASATFCTAELLSRCLDTDPTLMSYADLGYAAFGTKGRALISTLFTVDLLAIGVSLIILFGDSLHALFPDYSLNFFKILGFFVVTPPVFLPLSVLSNISLLGILSTIGTVSLITFCGLLRSTTPGSLLHPMPTHLWPADFKSFCLSIGLLSACWGGHAVFPNLKTDMRHPHKFKDCLKTTYKITAVTDIGTAIVGFIMFGDQVKDEITKNVLLSDHYPTYLYGLISALMTVIPIAKTPLNARPIISVLDTICNIQNAESKFRGTKLTLAKCIKVLNCIFVNILFVVIAILFPQFDKIIAFLGAGLVFTICLILPCLFYLRICKDTIKPWEKLACKVTIFISIICSALGIGAAILA